MRRLESACSPEQASDGVYSEHNAYDGPKREIESAGIKQ
jgi:hypothetical protein